MKFTTLLTLIPLTTPILAATEIPAAIASITTSTQTLQNTLKSWDGKLLSTLPILSNSAHLLHAIKDGTKKAEASDPLTFDETIQVAGATQNLAGVVNGTLEILIGLKPKFDKVLLSPAILLNLHLEKDATNDFSEAVIEKVPEPLQETAKGLVQGIENSFNKAIDKYALFK